MSVSISILCENLVLFPCDVFVLKYADANRGADLAVANTLGTNEIRAEVNQHKFIKIDGKLKAAELLVIGVGPLSTFEYIEIEQFGKTALEIVAQERPGAQVVGLTIHGPGYGLDELAAVDSLVRGLEHGARAFGVRDIQVVIVEKSPARAQRLREFMAGRRGRSANAAQGSAAAVATSISREHTYSKRLFAAMPFKPSFLDHWELAIQPAAHGADVLIERLDYEHFTGDIISEIRNRITKCVAVVALLDESNPNVFLEIGYAWGLGKPTILALHLASEPPFDVRGHKILRYGRLGELKATITAELAGLARIGLI